MKQLIRRELDDVSQKESEQMLLTFEEAGHQLVNDVL